MYHYGENRGHQLLRSVYSSFLCSHFPRLAYLMMANQVPNFLCVHVLCVHEAVSFAHFLFI